MTYFEQANRSGLVHFTTPQLRQRSDRLVFPPTPATSSTPRRAGACVCVLYSLLWCVCVRVCVCVCVLTKLLSRVLSFLFSLLPPQNTPSLLPPQNALTSTEHAFSLTSTEQAFSLTSTEHAFSLTSTGTMLEEKSPSPRNGVASDAQHLCVGAYVTCLTRACV